MIPKTAKQLKKIQRDYERVLRMGASIIAHWSYEDAPTTRIMVSEAFAKSNHSAPATIIEIHKDSIKATLDADEVDGHGVSIYPAGWVLWLPRTNNSAWRVSNRFEKYKK